ncbi:MAG: luciferase family protein [Ornithinimicrobium sp.]
MDQCASAALWIELCSRVFELPGVVEGISQISPESSRAVLLRDLAQEISPESSLAPRQRLEPVHVHGEQDTSVHLVLPPARGEELVRLGWAEPHQYADFGTEFMVYGPRSESELDAIMSVIQESLAFARGAGLHEG